MDTTVARTEETPAASAGATAAGPRVAPAGWVALALLTAVVAVWAWQFGGWFATALYPGTLVLVAGLILLALFAPVRVRVRGWAALALGALVALGLWAGISALWSPAPDVAVEDAQRILTYAVAFALGLWLCDLLRARVHLAMAPLAVAGLCAGTLTIGTMLTTSDLGQVLSAGTLQYPIGYRNANAAFFLIALWPAIGLAATPELDWRLRALSLGTATLCLELGVLSQSRASIVAGAVAGLVWLLTSRDRARAVLWLALAVAPALVVLPALTDLYRAAEDLGRAQILSEVDAAARAAALGAVLATFAGAIVALLGRRYPASKAALRTANRAVVAGAVVLAVAGVVSFVVAVGDPVEWVGERASEFQSRSGTPHEQGRSSRFEFNASTERDEMWRVALDDVRDAPLGGTGAGGYYYSYLRERRAEGVESARDAHSIEFEVAGELGVVGLTLLAVALLAAVVGAVRSRRVSPQAAGLSACALTAGAYWLAHASIDWHWPFPALSAAVLALLGSACAPALLGPGTARRRPGRWLVIAAAAALAVSVVPPYLSDRYVDQAYEVWSRDLQRAYDDLDRAAALNPLAEEPLLAEGIIAREVRDRARAIDAFERAAEKRPEEWASHYFLATLYRARDEAAARRELETALDQNPHSDRLEELEARFEATARP